mmetsp:Transcript_49875/g.97585  ORF Transcript_49875/g.97585 Transcript_49875/m.97585 type:complete len:88 (+) Transcript_49875:58-321(+)
MEAVVEAEMGMTVVLASVPANMVTTLTIGVEVTAVEVEDSVTIAEGDMAVAVVDLEAGAEEVEGAEGAPEFHVPTRWMSLPITSSMN